MPDDLRTRIAAALLGDHCVQGMTQPCDDCQAHALRQADAVIRELRLEALELLARSWYRNYDTIPANDPRCPTDMDIAYDDAGMQILTALGILHA